MVKTSAQEIPTINKPSSVCIMRDGVTVIQISGGPLTLQPGRSLSSSNPTCVSINGTDIRFNEPAVLTNEGMGILSLTAGKEYENFHFPEIEKSSLVLG